MNRQQALEWLVANVVKWPKTITSINNLPPWFWVGERGEVIFWKPANFELITKSDWLAATDKMQVKEQANEAMQ